MAHNDKTWLYVTQNISTTPNADGTIPVFDTSGFFTDQICNLSASGLATLTVQITDVVSPTILRAVQLQLNNQASNPPFPATPTRTNAGTNFSAYTPALAAQIQTQLYQLKQADANNTPFFVYQCDPVAAERSYQVDQYGRPGIATSPASLQFITVGNATITAGNVTVGVAFNAASLSFNAKLVTVWNDTNADLSIAFNGATNLRLTSGETVQLPLGAAGVYMTYGTTVGVFLSTSTTPTSGVVKLSFVG